MNTVLAKVKGPRKKPYFKILSDCSLFSEVVVPDGCCVAYNPDHNLDDDSWFRIERFSQQTFSLSIFNGDFDSKDYDDLTKQQFPKISCIIAVQGDDFYFQKITPSLFIKRKTIAFGEAAIVEESKGRLVINSIPDAVYRKASDSLVFRDLVTISSIFKDIDVLYKEATEDEVEQFLEESFIGLSADYDAGKVSKPNRKRIALAMNTLSTMSEGARTEMLDYINSYCEERLTLDKAAGTFEITSDEELKFLLYGIEQRFYTTPFGHEKRLANSVQKLT
ncbi:Uncharacterised protein [Serratia quinivorans]|jgi:hypothetical protein|uniref:ATP F0F1 synthase synthase n=1 Tax=Serratia quinivorans TaxID=137545 RepID=A0ABV3UP04_9GAMM|nr:ATP F0F1 synthase synthase [Serratia quinivorans]CAI2027257.1 Uncharacterised protein [Serratia quinivorans]